MASSLRVSGVVGRERAPGARGSSTWSFSCPQAAQAPPPPPSPPWVWTWTDLPQTWQPPPHGRGEQGCSVRGGREMAPGARGSSTWSFSGPQAAQAPPSSPPQARARSGATGVAVAAPGCQSGEAVILAHAQGLQLSGARLAQWVKRCMHACGVCGYATCIIPGLGCFPMREIHNLGASP